MKKKEMIKTNEFKELVKQFMIEEAYGACNIEIQPKGLKFKPRETDEEIELRIDYFIERVI